MDLSISQSDLDLRGRILDAINHERQETLALLNTLLSFSSQREHLGAHSTVILDTSLAFSLKRLTRLDTKRRQLTPDRRSLLHEEADDLIERLERSQGGPAEEEEKNEEDKETDVELQLQSVFEPYPR